jgi:hypothetical protein
VDANAGPELARVRGIVPRHVDDDDGSDDAAAIRCDVVAVSFGGQEERRDAIGMSSVMVALGYFAVWSGIGVTLCPLAAILLRQTQAGASWRAGVRLAIHCARSCAPLMAIALVVGGTDYRVMAAVTAATTIQRLAPSLSLQLVVARLRHKIRIDELRASTLCKSADDDRLHWWSCISIL